VGAHALCQRSAMSPERVQAGDTIRPTVGCVPRRDHIRPEWVGNRPEVAKCLARCVSCGVEGRTVDPIPPGAHYGHWLKAHYEPLYDERCAQYAAVLGDA
jgi:hypothetical protein